jgi:tRNA pseudouridine32 synthase/23S rRNA pseudouridine746 synthase
MPIKDMSPEEMRPEPVKPEAMAPQVMTPEAILGRVLHRDGLMLVLDKPAGLPVHRGPKGGGSLEDWFDHLRYGLPRAPALAHRLDKDTSGCLVLGRHRKALAHLGLLFKHGKVGKTYWAVVEGGPDKEEGVIDLPLARLDESRGWWMKPDPKGLPSVTTWKVLGRSGHGGGSGLGDAGATSPASPLTSLMTWLALTPVTGRTHQLRVHCAAMGWPILGDNIYGTAPRFGGPVMHLHAREITVPLSKNKPPVRVVAQVPAHMRERLAACGWNVGDQQVKENNAGLQPVAS